MARPDPCLAALRDGAHWFEREHRAEPWSSSEQRKRAYTLAGQRLCRELFHGLITLWGTVLPAPVACRRERRGDQGAVAVRDARLGNKRRSECGRNFADVRLPHAPCVGLNGGPRPSSWRTRPRGEGRELPQ